MLPHCVVRLSHDEKLRKVGLHQLTLKLQQQQQQQNKK